MGVAEAFELAGLGGTGTGELIPGTTVLVGVAETIKLAGIAGAGTRSPTPRAPILVKVAEAVEVPITRGESTSPFIPPSSRLMCVAEAREMTVLCRSHGGTPVIVRSKVLPEMFEAIAGTIRLQGHRRIGDGGVGMLIRCVREFSDQFLDHAHGGTRWSAPKFGSSLTPTIRPGGHRQRDPGSSSVPKGKLNSKTPHPTSRGTLPQRDESRV